MTSIWGINPGHGLKKLESSMFFYLKYSSSSKTSFVGFLGGGCSRGGGNWGTLRIPFGKIGDLGEHW